MKHIAAESFGGAVTAAVRMCKGNSPVLNLALTVVTDFRDESNAFLAPYEESALEWQAAIRPSGYHFNHGEYIHRHGDSVAYLIDQLVNKRSGNRACISLVDNKDIMSSGDGRLPSLLLIQGGISEEDPKRLFLTAYFRALEVGTFLPINFAEILVIAKRVRERIPSLSLMEVTVHAFRAHHVPNFSTHRISLLDMADPREIQRLADARDFSTIAGWLGDKAKPESIVELAGLAELIAAARSSDWDSDITHQLELTLATLTVLKTVRASGSQVEAIVELQDDLSSQLRALEARLRRLEDEGVG